MKKLLLSPILVLVALVSYADNFLYSVLTLDSQLTRKANAVIRLDETRYQINSTEETVTRTHFIITVLNEKGNEYAVFQEYYNKHTDITSLDGILYDAWGKELNKVKKKDVEDLSAVSGGTMMSDNRLKYHNFYYKVYPYTVEYIYEVKDKSTLFFPKWTPQPDEFISVENSSITITAPADYVLRYKAFNYDKAPVITTDKNLKNYTWSAKKLKPIIREPNAPMWHELTTMVIFGPSAFQMDDYKGNMESWQDFGRFVYELKKGRDVLPDNVKAKVHEIADRIPDKRQKIAKLYEYMQQNTRYISVQLGIGGWQPFDAKYVASNGYGDCKALTNYMYSLLKEAGINSNYTLVKSGRYSRYITEDFPSQQFNHVILSIPMQGDTMWLECTSQTQPAGYLGDFTCDRPALLIDENGGKLIRTPVYGLKENLEVRNIKAVLADDGSLAVKTISNYSGLQQDDIHDRIHSLSKEKIKEELHNELDFATYDIIAFNYEEEKTKLPSIIEHLDISVSNYATFTGKRLFIVPNIMTRSRSRLSTDTARRYDVLINYAYTDIDSVEIDIPAGYNAEAVPQPAKISSPFGNYFASVKYADNKLYYYRKVELLNGRFPAASYNDLVKFYDAVYKADRSKVVLVKPQ